MSKSSQKEKLTNVQKIWTTLHNPWGLKQTPKVTTTKWRIWRKSYRKISTSSLSYTIYFNQVEALAIGLTAIWPCAMILYGWWTTTVIVWWEVTMVTKVAVKDRGKKITQSVVVDIPCYLHFKTKIKLQQ